MANSTDRVRQTAGLIVCERQGGWAAALRRELEFSGVALFETRSLHHCRELLAAAPASLAAMEIGLQNAPQVLDWLAGLTVEFPAARAALLAPRSLADYEPLARELGAVAFVTSPRRLAPLTAAARRWLARQPESAPSAAERMMAELPWS